MPTATLAVCYAAKVKPTPENRRKARQTIYQWARNRHNSDWPGQLIEHLDVVTCCATVLGLPICQWEYNTVGKKWPKFRWPSRKRNQDAENAAMHEWNRIAQRQMTALWDWFDKVKND